MAKRDMFVSKIRAGHVEPRFIQVTALYKVAGWIQLSIGTLLSIAKNVINDFQKRSTFEMLLIKIFL